MSKIGVFGGSFNPVHNGHIMLAKTALEQLKLSKLLIVPASVPPHKSSADYAAAHHRLEMCRLATRTLPDTEVSSTELERKGVSYTADTLTELSDIYKGSDFYLIMGADMFLTVQDWHDPQRIFALAKLCAVPRDAADIQKLRCHAEYLGKIGADSLLMNVPKVDISSTEIRRRVKNGESISGTVCNEVEKYIIANGIYRD